MNQLTAAYLVTQLFRAAFRHWQITLVLLVLAVLLIVYPATAPAFLAGLTGGGH